MSGRVRLACSVRGNSVRRKSGIATVAIMLIGCWPGDAQVTERFEVASVRISPPGGTGITSWNDSEASTFSATNIPLRTLIQMAYTVDEKQISGENLLGTDQYDIAARPEGGGMLTQERLKPMLRSMLAETFRADRSQGDDNRFRLRTRNGSGGSKATRKRRRPRGSVGNTPRSDNWSRCGHAFTRLNAWAATRRAGTGRDRYQGSLRYRFEVRAG